MLVLFQIELYLIKAYLVQHKFIGLNVHKTI